MIIMTLKAEAIHVQRGRGEMHLIFNSMSILLSRHSLSLCVLFPKKNANYRS